MSAGRTDYAYAKLGQLLPDPVIAGDRRCVSDLYVSGFDARHEDSVTVHKLPKGVPDGITGPPYSDGLHHAGVSQLTNTQLPVK